MENINDDLLESYAIYSQIINKQNIQIWYENSMHINYDDIELRVCKIIDHLIKDCYSKKKYEDYKTNKSNLIQYIKSLINVYDNYKKIIMEDRYTELLALIDDESMFRYIIKIIVENGKLQALNIILENYSNKETINILLATPMPPKYFIDIYTIIFEHDININYNILFETCAFSDEYLYNIKFLLDSKMDPNIYDGKLFGKICKSQNLKIVEIFISYGITHKNLNMGLLYAASVRKYDTMKLLIENGADPQFLNEAIADTNLDSLHWLENNNVNMLKLMHSTPQILQAVIDKKN